MVRREWSLRQRLTHLGPTLRISTGTEALRVPCRGDRSFYGAFLSLSGSQSDGQSRVCRHACLTSHAFVAWRGGPHVREKATTNMTGKSRIPAPFPPESETDPTPTPTRTTDDRCKGIPEQSTFLFILDLYSSLGIPLKVLILADRLQGTSSRSCKLFTVENSFDWIHIRDHQESAKPSPSRP